MVRIVAPLTYENLSIDNGKCAIYKRPVNVFVFKEFVYGLPVKRNMYLDDLKNMMYSLPGVIISLQLFRQTHTHHYLLWFFRASCSSCSEIVPPSSYR